MALFSDLSVLAMSPVVFSAMAFERTKELTAFVQSGIVREQPILTKWLNSEIGNGGGSQTLNRPTWNDLDSSNVERTGSDANSPLYLTGTQIAALAGTGFFPPAQGISTHNVIAVRVDRNNHWAASTLAAAVDGLNSPDPIGVIGDLVGTYWARRFQTYCLAIIAGVVADNTANDSGDYTFDVSGAGFVPGVTNFTAEALIDALATLGDADNQITNLAVHSKVRNRMRKNNLIDFVADSEGNLTIPTFQGLILTVDDGLPVTGNVYDSYLFGPGFLEYGTAIPKNATTTVWRDEAGNGMGSEELWNRVCWCVHPMGHAYVGAVPSTGGGPLNSVLDDAASWDRRAQTRKNVPFARLVTREA